jgi:hypothetical protein
MANKLLGLGTVLKVDENDDATGHTTVTLVMNITPPARERELIDGTSLSDTLATYEAGIEQHSEFTFTQFWEPGDSQHESIDTLFGSKTAVEWQIVYTNGTPETDEFEGFVSRLGPQTIEVNNLVMREVTVQRKTAIARS